MIRIFKDNDLDIVMNIWLDTNIKAHDFISKDYWINNYDMVKELLPKAEIYVYENDSTNQIEGFIGLNDTYIAGIFVKDIVQSKGIGKQLLDYAKSLKLELSLNVYQKNIRAIKFYEREGFQTQSLCIDENTNTKELIMTWNK